MRISLLSLLPIALAVPATQFDRADKPVYWVLAGDSTTAKGGGWGDGFLSTTVAKPSSGRNLGDGGATTKSFRNEGFWGKVLEDVAAKKKDYRVYVTIQFGHNDQKVENNVSDAEFKTNLAKFASEVTSTGGTPILVTSLTRRTFDTTTKKVIENLATPRKLTIEVAEANGLRWIDLNRASTDYVNAIGQTAADVYNLAPKDRTHVNERGGVVFARIVSDLLVKKYAGEFEGVTLKNKTLSALIASGKPA